MSSYEALAASYDALMADASYRKRADFLERLLRKSAIYSGLYEEYRRASSEKTGEGTR